MILEYIISFILLHSFDYGYIILNKSKVSKYITSIQLEPIHFKYKYIFITYIIISYAISLFVLPKIRDTHMLKDSIHYGISLGLVIYGVSNLHNRALFKKQNKYLFYSDLIIRTLSLIIVIYITKRITLFLKHIL
jgi:uncharacterized membrane protein